MTHRNTTLGDIDIVWADDHDPLDEGVDAAMGAWVFYQPEGQIWRWYVKLDDGQSTNLSPIMSRNNLTGVAPPTTNDDVTKGYGVTSSWADTVGGNIYFCISPAFGAAVWKIAT
jgi:hypothetical protein